MVKKNKIAFINSCYNPSKDWETAYIDRAKEYESLLPDMDCHFVLVNDGSTTNLFDAIQTIKNHLPKFEFVEYEINKGKGFALRKGLEQIEADYYCYTDVDFPYTGSSMKTMVERIIHDEVDVVLGKRSKAYFNKIPLQRKYISLLLINFNKYLLRLPFPDTQCGIKVINQKAKQTFLSVKTNGFLFEVEFVQKAVKYYNLATEYVELRENTQLKKVRFNLLINLFKEYLKLK
jgi:glycosyltransferase involved in cell wall biosynthesis